METTPARAVRQIFSNLGLLLSGKAVAGLMSLAYLLIVTRALGASGFGVLVLLHGYVSLIGTLIAFSGWHAIVRYGTLAHQADDHDRLLRLIRFMSLLELGCGLAAIFVAAVLLPWVGPALNWPPEAMALAIPYTLAIIAGTLALIIPGIFLAVRLYFAAQAAVVDDAHGVEALRRSWRLVEDSWWRTFGLVVLANVAIAVPGLLLTTPFAALAESSDRAVWALVGSMLASAVTAPFVALYSTLLYYDLLARAGTR